MNELRRKAWMLISGTKSCRPPAFRRSLSEDALYATDLPKVAEENEVADFRRRAEQAGWHTIMENGWILMDFVPEKMPADGFQGPFGPEAKCCASLLNRHAGDRGPDGKKEKRMLLKAGEEGAAAYERACGQIHREWAAALRKREMLPKISTDYFTGRKEG